MAAGIRYSVVVPVRDEEEVLPEFYSRVGEAMRATGEPYELLFVDDGSTDGSLPLLERLAGEDPAVRVVCLSRSFGHQAALAAGLDRARGDAVVTLDADLQDPPSLIGEMIARWQGGAEVVSARRARRRGERLLKKAAAFLFSRLLRRISAVRMAVDTADFRLLDRRVCDSLRALPERRRYLRGMVSWVGFSQAEVLYERQGRAAGKPKYRWGGSFRLAMDAVTSFSRAPLRTALWLGLLVIAGGLGALAYALARGPAAVPSRVWALAIPVLLVTNGLTLVMIGLLGQYVGRISDEVKGRPLYVVAKLVGFGAESPSGRRSSE